MGSDGLIYVPSAAVGGITVLKPRPDGSAVTVHHINLNYPIDNISEDANGDLFLATFPKALPVMAMFDKSVETPSAPTTVWKVTRLNREIADKYEYELVKVIEDRDAEVLPTATTVIHDALTGRLFLTGRFS